MLDSHRSDDSGAKVVRWTTFGGVTVPKWIPLMPVMGGGWCDFALLTAGSSGCLIRGGVVRPVAAQRAGWTVFEIGKPNLTSETRKGLPSSFVELPTGRCPLFARHPDAVVDRPCT